MTGEEWARYVERLSGELREFAQNVMRRVDRLLNRDRSLWLEQMQRLERRADGHTQRIGELEGDTRRFSGQMERLEERIESVEIQSRAIAEHVARLQRENSDGQR